MGGIHGRKVAVVDPTVKQETDGALIEQQEQALIMYHDKTGEVAVIQPYSDGSYWRKIVRNKVLRMKKQRRVQAAKEYVEKLGVDNVKVGSTWGPYKSTSSTAPALMQNK